MKISSQELVQSYILTTAKYDFSVYEKRILYRLVELAQSDMNGKKLNRNYAIGENLFKDKIITMPLTSFMKENEQNHSRIKKALTDLRNKTLEYDDGDNWRLIGIIEKPEFKKSSGTVKFEVQPMIWKALLNFTKGFSKYELKTAMEFDSVYAMRFYELFSNNLQPLTFTIEELKERFGIENKYKNKPTNFIKKVVLKAKIELDKKAPYSFEFTPLKTGRKLTAIKFIPYKIPENVDIALEKKKLELKTSSAWVLPHQIRRYLIEKCGFNEKGIRTNIELLKRGYESFDLISWLAELHPKASLANNPPGYVIGALKKYLEQKSPEAQKIDSLIEEVANNLKP